MDVTVALALKLAAEYDPNPFDAGTESSMLTGAVLTLAAEVRRLSNIEQANIKTIKTEDGKFVGPGDTVFNYYDRWWGVVQDDVDSQGWFHVASFDGSGRDALLNGARIATFDPQGTRKPF